MLLFFNMKVHIYINYKRACTAMAHTRCENIQNVMNFRIPLRIAGVTRCDICIDFKHLFITGTDGRIRNWNALLCLWRNIVKSLLVTCQVHEKNLFRHQLRPLSAYFWPLEFELSLQKGYLV